MYNKKLIKNDVRVSANNFYKINSSNVKNRYNIISNIQYQVA